MNGTRATGTQIVAPIGSGAPVSEQLAAAFAEAPAVSIAEIRLPESVYRSTTLLAQRRDGLVQPIFVDPYGVRVLGKSAGVVVAARRHAQSPWRLAVGQRREWLLELGACWAMVMIVSGLYLWWPRGMGWPRALWPRTRKGARVFWRDLHACVAAWFSILILCFLLTALPWTAFWGGQISAQYSAVWISRTPPDSAPAARRWVPSFSPVARSTGSLPRRDGTVSLGRWRSDSAQNRTANGGFTMSTRRPGRTDTSSPTGIPVMSMRTSAARRIQ